ncbi:hypothetical protein KUTeg_010242 [Tegillarca granosa]|uniref:Uncharacterized protein n=1 Tax=Tegillarca granosa TaxID=220873 RepID=A0ABQ9F6C2_TEGGR|nr:hypothetical protein KUTeg_010242 [Tegillarca granosa]
MSGTDDDDDDENNDDDDDVYDKDIKIKNINSFVKKQIGNTVRLSYASYENTKIKEDNNKPPIFIMHGMFGSKSNWHSLAKRFSSGGRKDSHVRQFLATNMIHKDGRFRWRVNLDSIINNYLPLCKFPEFDTQYKGPTLFIGGSESEYIK